MRRKITVAVLLLGAFGAVVLSPKDKPARERVADQDKVRAVELGAERNRLVKELRGLSAKHGHGCPESNQVIAEMRAVYAELDTICDRHPEWEPLTLVIIP